MDTIYHRVYAPLRHKTFYSLKELNDSIRELTRAHNQKRMQQKPYTREEQFLSAEREMLLPLPACDYEVEYNAKLQVGTNNCIYLGRDKHYYSVQYRLIGSKVNVIYIRTIVKVYSQGELVATHTRDMRQGKYSLMNEHLPKNASEYRSRGKQYYIDKGSFMMTELGTLIEHVFCTSTQPEVVHYKTCDAILHLAKTTDPTLMREACAIADAKRMYNYGFISNLVKTLPITKSKSNTQPSAPPANHAGLRGKDAFQ